jgi:S1-C subfamily serine protease
MIGPPLRFLEQDMKNLILHGIYFVLGTFFVVGCASGPTGALTPHPVTGQDGQASIVSNPRSAIVATPTALSPSVVDQADAAQKVLINVYQRVDPAVVNIETDTDNLDDLDSSGSGFVLDTDGHILTNSHVVQGAKSILVTFYDGYAKSATVVGTDDYSDLAVIKVDVAKRRLLPVTLGDSSNLQVGQRVVAIGNPFGLLSSMTTGIISATGRTLKSAYMLNPRNVGPATDYSNPSIIQVDAQINPGNSGGPLLDINGNVIGVTTAIRTDTGVFQGVGFAVPINTAKRIIPQLIKNGKAEYSWLGIKSVGGQGGLSVAALAEPLKLPVDHGILVSEVIADSPAAIAGLRGGSNTTRIRGVDVTLGGDIIVAINDQALRDMDALIGYLVANTAPEDTITLTIIRDNQTFDVKVTLKARPTGGS